MGDLTLLPPGLSADARPDYRARERERRRGPTGGPTPLAGRSAAPVA